MLLYERFMLYNIVMNKIEVQNLNKKFGDIEALSNFSYAFEEGKKYFIVGPTGSGKTTLLNIIAGIESGDEKSIVKINGVDRGSLPLENSNVSYILSQPLFFKNKNVYKNLEYQAKVCGKNLSKYEIEEFAQRFNLDPNEKVKKLSYVEKIFLSFARIEIKNSEIVLIDFDEFLEDFDSQSDAFRMIISWIENYSGTVIVAENGLNLVSKCKAGILFLNYGVNKGLIALETEERKPSNFYLYKCIKKSKGESVGAVKVVVEKTMCGTAINSSGLEKGDAKKLISIVDKLFSFRVGDSLEVVFADGWFFEKFGGKILN